MSKFYHTGDANAYLNWRTDTDSAIMAICDTPGYDDVCDTMQQRSNCTCGGTSCGYRSRLMCAWDDMFQLASQVLKEKD